MAIKRRINRYPKKCDICTRTALVAFMLELDFLKPVHFLKRSTQRFQKSHNFSLLMKTEGATTFQSFPNFGLKPLIFMKERNSG